MKALVVDDDRILADLLNFTLRREGFQVTQAYDGETALQKCSEDYPDIVILDVNFPSSKLNMDGFAVCKKIRETSSVPIILLTVHADEDDIVYGLKMGADDYILKPFSPRQLIARVFAVLRRAGKTVVPAEREFDGLQLDTVRRTVVVFGGQPVPLTPLEYRLLDYLMLNAGQVLPFDEMISHIWGSNGGDRDMLRQLVHRLRTKIEPGSSEMTFIETIPAVGYSLTKAKG